MAPNVNLVIIFYCIAILMDHRRDVLYTDTMDFHLQPVCSSTMVYSAQTLYIHHNINHREGFIQYSHKNLIRMRKT